MKLSRLVRPFALSAAMALCGEGALAEAVTYNIDPAHVWLVFKIQQYVFGKAIGQFKHVRGVIKFDHADVTASSVTAEIEVDSVDTGDEGRDAEVPGFIGVGAHPKITFTSTKVEKLDDTHGRVTGDLTLAGKTQSVSLEVTFNGEADSMFTGVHTIGFSANGSVNADDFGIPGLKDMKDTKLGPEVDYQIEVQALKSAN